MEIQNIKTALDLLESSSEFALLIPEVRSNLVMSKTQPKGVEDVAGVPGRITIIKGMPKSCANPDYGVSSHMARFIINIMEYNPEKRSAINFRYDPQLVKIAEKLGLIVSFYDRQEEPEALRKEEGATIPWGVKTAIKRAGEVPDLIYHKGGWGKEPSMVLIGNNPEEVVKIAICIAKLFQNKIDKINNNG